VAHVNLLKQFKTGTGWVMKSIPRKPNGQRDWGALPDGSYFIEWREEGKRMRSPAGSTVSQALEAQRIKLAEIAATEVGILQRYKPLQPPPEPEPIRLSAQIRRYLDQIDTLKKPNTYRKYNAVLMRFDEHFPGRELKQISDEELNDFVIKLRIVRFLRTPEYDALFSGDPTWVTEAIGGMGDDGRTLVTRTSFRLLQTLNNLGPGPEPNLTVLWSPRLPQGFKDFAARVSIDTSSIQYESDELLRSVTGDDTAIACCVSAMPVGKQMQFFGARVNLAKTLLYAINGGRDEVSGEQVAPPSTPVTGEYLDYDDVRAKLDAEMDWLARIYVDALNVIHYMHDKYAYERLEMALHDYPVRRTMAMGIAGLAVVADSLSAIRDARVKVVRDDRGLVVDYEVEGDYPAYGNNDDRADELAVWIVEQFMGKVRQHPTYRDAVHTQSVLTITSNVVYGKATGNTPDGRRSGEPFSPGANPMNGRDQHGWVASALSVAKLPYDQALDGISLTSTLVPSVLGKTPAEQVATLTGLLDGYFEGSGFHVNINVLNRDTLVDAMEHPEKYPQLTIRVSGYAVNFVRLTREQQLDVLHRTFHGAL